MKTLILKTIVMEFYQDFNMAINNDRETNSTEIRNSRYVQGGETDRYANRLGWWERRTMPRQDDDIQYTIDKRVEGRPDLIAHHVYGKVQLMWLVLQYNNIVDVETELVAGEEIFLPTMERVMLSIMTKPVGGNPVT